MGRPSEIAKRLQDLKQTAQAFQAEYKNFCDAYEKATPERQKKFSEEKQDFDKAIATLKSFGL